MLFCELYKIMENKVIFVGVGGPIPPQYPPLLGAVQLITILGAAQKRKAKSVVSVR